MPPATARARLVSASESAAARCPRRAAASASSAKASGAIGVLQRRPLAARARPRSAIRRAAAPARRAPASRWRRRAGRRSAPAARARGPAPRCRATPSARSIHTRPSAVCTAADPDAGRRHASARRWPDRRGPSRRRRAPRSSARPGSPRPGPPRTRGAPAPPGLAPPPRADPPGSRRGRASAGASLIACSSARRAASRLPVAASDDALQVMGVGARAVERQRRVERRRAAAPVSPWRYRVSAQLVRARAGRDPRCASEAR